MSLERSPQEVRQSISEFFADESGATLIEYGLVAALIAFAIFSIIVSMGESVNTAFTGVNSGLESVIDNM